MPDPIKDAAGGESLPAAPPKSAPAPAAKSSLTVAPGRFAPMLSRDELLALAEKTDPKARAAAGVNDLLPQSHRGLWELLHSTAAELAALNK